MLFAGDYEDCRSRLVEQGQVMAESIPGYTVPREQPVLLALRWNPEAARTVSAEEGLRVEAEDAEVEALGTNGAYHIIRIAFRQLGERTVRVNYGGKYMNVYYFVTQDVRTMLGKRASFIAGKQIRDEEKWYNGLLAEYNNETGRS